MNPQMRPRSKLEMTDAFNVAAMRSIGRVDDRLIEVDQKHQFSRRQHVLLVLGAQLVSQLKIYCLIDLRVLDPIKSEICCGCCNSISSTTGSFTPFISCMLMLYGFCPVCFLYYRFSSFIANITFSFIIHTSQRESPLLHNFSP